LARGSDYNLTGQLNYTGYRAELSLSHNSILDLDGVQTSRDVTRFNFGTALVFADGHFGWSRPVHDSFALVVPQGNLAGRAVGVNPVHDGYLARSDALGPAVISHLQPYALSQLLIEVPDLPLGYAIGDQQPALLPTYRSGTVIRIGTDATVFLRGTLQDRDGQPIALRTGQVRSLSDDDWSPVALFTNRAGRFATEGLKPGEYELSLTGDTSMMVRFSIPDDTSGLYDVGELQLLDTDD
jgi:outer membrane usher protein